MEKSSPKERERIRKWVSFDPSGDGGHGGMIVEVSKAHGLPCQRNWTTFIGSDG